MPRLFHDIVGMITFATCIAAVAFVFGMIGSFFLADANFVERLALAAMVFAMTFVAAFCLSWRDCAHQRRALSAIRRELLFRADVSEKEFATHFPGVELTLMSQTRQAIAEFFDVPLPKIHPADDLSRDLRTETLEPGFQFGIIQRVFSLRNVVIEEPFLVSTCQPKAIADLAVHIQSLIQCNQERDRFPKSG